MTSLPKSIVFITGTFTGSNCWDEWKNYFESNGYKCIAPAWPYKDAAPEELRNRPAYNNISLNTINSLTNHFAAIINALPEKPILIGHSLGGLIVQLLMQQELGAIGVAMHSFPPSGVGSLRFSLMKAVWEAMAFFSSSKKTYLMPFATWRYAMINGLEYDEQKELYYRYATPESKKILREAFKCVAIIDFKKEHAPLLFTAGGMDKLTPPSINFNNYKRYADRYSTIDYKEFKDHAHLVFGHPAWKTEADYVLHWLSCIDDFK